MGDELAGGRVGGRRGYGGVESVAVGDQEEGERESGMTGK